MQKYVMWELHELNDITIAIYPKENIMLRLESSPFLHGWWPFMPNAGEAVIVTGICLFDARWRVRFKPVKMGQKGAERSLALPREREEILEMISKGREIEAVYYPLFPTLYAKKMLEWQKWALEFMENSCGIEPIKVLYHIPLQEYLVYCRLLPLNLKSKMEEIIKIETDKIIETVKETLGNWPIEFHLGEDNPPESFVKLYLYALERYNISIIGLEELVELRLPLEAMRKTNQVITTLVGVLGIPHPYFRPEGGKEEVIE